MGNPVPALAYYFLKARHPTDEPLSTILIPSHHMQLYLERKLTIEILLHHPLLAPRKIVLLKISSLLAIEPETTACKALTLRTYK